MNWNILRNISFKTLFLFVNIIQKLDNFLQFKTKNNPFPPYEKDGLQDTPPLEIFGTISKCQLPSCSILGMGAY